MNDKEKVLKGLKACSDDKGDCKNCPYNYEKGLRCIVYMTKDALELLREQSEIVRCKDCKHYMTIYCACDGCCISDNWFCADGEAKQE